MEFVCKPCADIDPSIETVVKVPSEAISHLRDVHQISPPWRSYFEANPEKQ